MAINGRLEAYQALGLATANVVSFFVMVGGGLLWAFEIEGMEDLRGRVGRGREREREREGGEGGEDEVELEVEEWVASLTGKGGGEERRWSARGPDDGEERARDRGNEMGGPR